MIGKVGSFFKCSLWIKIRNWLLYGVLWSFIPIFFLVICKVIIGYNVSMSDLMPDYLLIVFAVSVNLLGNTVDCKESIEEDKRKNIAGFSRFSMAICACFYLAFFSEFVSRDIIAIFGSQERPLMYLFAGITAILIVLAISGIVLKRREEKTKGEVSSNLGN